MQTDRKDVANQKVFVKLADVLALQAEINRLAIVTGGDDSSISIRNFRRGMERAIEFLHLPVAR